MPSSETMDDALLVGIARKPRAALLPAPQPMTRVFSKRALVGAMRIPPAAQFTISVSRITMSMALTPSQSTPQVPAVMKRSPSMTFA